MKKIICLSGAGLSAPSGLSTFRDNDGLWDKYDLNVVCNYNTWRKNFSTVHDFYNKRRIELKNILPNKMHIKISDLNKRFKLINFTQNVDDLLERAGCDQVIHLHGELLKLHCTNCDYKIQYNLSDDLEYNLAKCPYCNDKYIKPSIIFFGEQAPLYTQLYNEFYNASDDDLIIIIGTSGAVINVNALLKFANCRKVLINLEKSEYIDESLFSNIIYKSCDECTEELEQIISQWNC